MSNSQSPEVKLKLLTVLAEHSGTWLPKSVLASKSKTHAERIQDTLDSFERQEFIKSQNWELLSKKEREELMSGTESTEIGSKTKKIYQIDLNGWKTLRRSLQDCFKDEHVLNLMNIPENIKEKLI